MERYSLNALPFLLVLRCLSFSVARSQLKDPYGVIDRYFILAYKIISKQKVSAILICRFNILNYFVCAEYSRPKDSPFGNF